MAEAAIGAYVYCVLPGDARPKLQDVRGVDPEYAVHAVSHRGLVALISGVSLSEFGAEPLKRNLNDMKWLERTARAHQRVLERALEAGTMVPLRLCTVCNDDAGVRALLEREHDVLARTLARLAGRQEWGLKLIADPPLASDATGQRTAQRTDPARPTRAPGSGRAYVERLRRDRLARDQAQQAERAAAQAIHRGLAAHAAAARVLRKPSRELSQDAGELVLNGAYLVERDRAAEFQALATELGERHCPPGMRVEITGPWPPYSFVAEHTDERRRAGAGVR